MQDLVHLEKPTTLSIVDGLSIEGKSRLASFDLIHLHSLFILIPSVVIHYHSHSIHVHSHSIRVHSYSFMFIRINLNSIHSPLK